MHCKLFRSYGHHTKPLGDVGWSSKEVLLQSFQPHKIFMRVTCKYGGLIVIDLGVWEVTNKIKGLLLRNTCA